MTSAKFAAVGLTLATVGLSIGLDQELVRRIAAVVLIAFGAVLLSPRWQDHFSSLTSGVGATAGGWLQRFQAQGWGAQFVVGLLMGLVWSPCVGPTLGATTALAAQGTHLSQVALLMLVFGLGAGTPLVIIGGLSREVAQRIRGRLLAGGRLGKLVLGGVMLVLGVAILAGWDKSLETLVVEISPDWLTRLTTRY